MNIKSPLQIQAYNYIKEKILSGTFIPDTYYSETKLAAEIGLSRTPMREALQCLSQDGYITIVPSKGFTIRQLTKKDMLESIQVRCAIEGYCTTLISKEINTLSGKHLLKELDTTLTQMYQLVESASTTPDILKQFIEWDHHFHQLLVNYVNNYEFTQLFQRLMYMIRLTSENALSKEGRIAQTLKEHQDYYDALSSGNGHAAYDILIHHLQMPIQL